MESQLSQRQQDQKEIEVFVREDFQQQVLWNFVREVLQNQLNEEKNA